jgi:hypothetical protein
MGRVTGYEEPFVNVYKIALGIIGCILLAGVAFSQQQNAASGTTQESSAASGPVQEYQGPTILSRDKSLIGERGGKLLDFRLYASAMGVYDTGLTPVATDQSGHLVNLGGAYGTEVGFGAMGSRNWKRDSLSLEYRGSYRHYTSNSYFDGTDQYLNLRWSHTVARHVTFDLKTQAGTNSLGNGAFSYLPFTNNDLFAVPANDLFDNRVYYGQTRLDLVWQKTARLSFSLGGDGYVVRRQSSALAGLNGYAAHGDISYRLTRRQTATLGYSAYGFDYQNVFGSALMHTLSLGYSIGLGRRWDVGFAAGGTYATVNGLRSITVDPAIVAIIGQPTIVENYQRSIAIPYAEARLIRRFQRSSFNVNASTGMSPGNGVYLTSRQTNIGAGYSYAGRTRWTYAGTFSYNELSTIGQSLGKYHGEQGGVGTTYKINEFLHAELRYDYRHYTTGSSIFRKDSHRVSLGLAFSPGERPLSIW